MGERDTARLGFARPGGEESEPCEARPIDMAHLSRQTMGDRELEREVLNLFLQQAASLQAEIAGAPTDQRAALAHKLKGSARGVGAFAIAECAEAIERDPADPKVLGLLQRRIDEARGFIAGVNR